MSFISDILINISAFRITIGNKINSLKTLIDGKANIAGNNIPPLTHWTNLHAGGLDDYVFHGSDVGSNFESVLVIDQGAIFRTNKGGMQSWLGLLPTPQHRRYTIITPSFNTTGIARIKIARQFAGMIKIHLTGDYSSANVNGYIELSGGLGCTAGGGIWNNQLRCTTSIGQTMSAFYIDPIIKKDPVDDMMYFEVHKKWGANNVICVEIELLSLVSFHASTNPVYESFDSSATVSTFHNQVSIFGLADSGTDKIVTVDNNGTLIRSDKSTADFQNNYLDIITTTNGTTAGTVYTFKRVGLSDLSITLTPASALFSGVVTTGAQVFAGVKRFESGSLRLGNGTEALYSSLQFGNLDLIPGNGRRFIFHAGYYFGGGSRSIGMTQQAENGTELSTLTMSDTHAVFKLAGVNYNLATEKWSKDNFHNIAKNATEATTSGFYSAAPINADLVYGNVSVFLQSGSSIGGISVANTHLISYGINAGNGFQIIKTSLNNDAPKVRTRNGGYWSTEETLAYQSYVNTQINSINIGNYYTKSQALSLFVGKTGVETIQDTKTFTHSPVVPNGTLAGHTVNLGQMQTYVTGLGYQNATQVTAIVNSAVAGIPAPGNGTVVLQGIGSLAGTATFSMNQTNNVVGSFDLTAQTKAQIQKGNDGANKLDEFFGGIKKYYQYHNVSGGGTGTALSEAFFNVLNPTNVSGLIIPVDDHEVDGARLVIQGVSGAGVNEFHGRFINKMEGSFQVLSLEGIDKEYAWNAEHGRWREVF